MKMTQMLLLLHCTAASVFTTACAVVSSEAEAVAAALAASAAAAASVSERENDFVQFDFIPIELEN